MSYRPNKTIWTFVQDTEPGKRQDGDTWFNPSTGQSWVWDATNGQWNEFRLTTSAGLGTAGYYAGGVLSGELSTIQRITFSTEAVAASTATLLVSRGLAMGCASLAHGYTMGGELSDSERSDIEKLAFLSEAASSIASTLSQVRRDGTGLNSRVAGYCVGGCPTNNTETNRVDKLDFTSEATARISDFMTPISQMRGCQSSQAGYLLGGFYYSGSNIYVSTVGRVGFRDDVISNLTSTMDSKVTQRGCCSAPNYGYGFGGYNGSSLTVIDRVAFSDESVTRLTTGLATAIRSGEMTNSHVAGYHACGYTTTTISAMQKLAFSDESVSTLTSNFGSLTIAMATFSNAN